MYTKRDRRGELEIKMWDYREKFKYITIWSISVSKKRDSSIFFWRWTIFLSFFFFWESLFYIYIYFSRRGSILLLLPWNEDLLLEERSKEPPLFHVTAGSTPKHNFCIIQRRLILATNIVLPGFPLKKDKHSCCIFFQAVYRKTYSLAFKIWILFVAIFHRTRVFCNIANRTIIIIIVYNSRSVIYK